MLLRKIFMPVLVAVSATAMPASASTNGLYLIGYGSESKLMGGADVAVARDPFAASNNPSGMTQLSSRAFEADFVAFTFMENSHSDAFNHGKDIVNGNSGFVNTAYARRFENTPFAAGVSLVAQGGMGWIYRGLNTVFGNRDDAGSTFSIAKLSPAFAWQVSDRLSLGGAIGINYVAIDQWLFPDTSTTAPFPFSGFRFKGASGTGINAKLGLQYRPAQDVVVGLTYGLPTPVPMKGGSLRINFSDPAFGSLGVVRYDNAKLEGVRMPEELALGVSFRPTPKLLVSVQEKWYNWSKALNTLTIVAREPRNAAAPPELRMPNTVNWNNQIVHAIGLTYDFSEDTLLLAGFNYGERPMPDQNLSPIFQPILQKRYTFGVNRRLNAEWRVTGGIEWNPRIRASYTNPLFGGDASARVENVMLNVAFGRRW